MTDFPDSTSLRRGWLAAAAVFVLAAGTGVWMRFGPVYGFPAGLTFANMRHAHSHLLYFGWVTPALMALIGFYLPRVGGNRPIHPRFGLPIALSILFGLLAWPPFLLYGYQPAQIGSARIPLSIAASGLNVIGWYLFLWRYWQATRHIPRALPVRLWDIAAICLFLATLGTWGLPVLMVAGIENMLLSRLLTHLFLDLFSEGWFVVALIGVALAPRPAAGNHPWIGRAVVALAVGVPFLFLFNIPPSLLPAPVAWVAAAAALLFALGTGGMALILWQHSRPADGVQALWWRLPLLFLGVQAVVKLVYLVPGGREWVVANALRVPYLHIMLLGWVTLGLVAAAAGAWGEQILPPRPRRWITAFGGTVALHISLLFLLTRLWPSAWWFNGITLLVAWSALLPVLLMAWLVVARLTAARSAGLMANRLRWWLVLLLIGVAGCGESADSPTLPPATPSAPLVATPLPAATATPLPTLPPTPTATPTPQPTATVAAALPETADPERCGLLLPLVPPVVTPSVTRLTGELPPALEVPENAQAALDWLRGNSADVALAAWRVGAENQGVYLNADVPMPLASVVKLLHLIAWSEAVAAGEIDPATWLPVSELERFWLQGSDLRSHPRAIAELAERGLISGDPPALPLEELPWSMMRHSSNTASDWMHAFLGQQRIEQTALTLGLTRQTAPCPFLGQFLTISNHTRTEDNEAAIRALIADPQAYGRLAWELTLAFSEDAAFREAEGRWYQRGRRPSWEAQSLFSENLNAHGSAGEYAALMARIAANELGDSYQSFLIRRNLEWPLAVYPVNQTLFYNVGYKDGSLPGILNMVYYAAPREGGGLVVVALFFRNLPQEVYQEWRRTLTHDDLARWLLTEPRAIPALRALVEGR